MNVCKRVMLGAVLAALIGAGASVASPVEVPVPTLYQRGVAKIEANLTPAEAKRGAVVTWTFTLELKPGYHSYPTEQTNPKSAAQVNLFDFPQPRDALPLVIAVGKIKEPPIKTHTLPSIGEQRYVEGKVTWEQKLVVSPQATPGSHEVLAEVEPLVCDDQTCLPPRTLKIKLPLTISDAEPVAVPAEYQDAVNKALTPPAAPAASPDNGAAPSTNPEEALAAYTAQMNEIRENLVFPDDGAVLGSPVAGSDLWAFILAGIFWGGISLVTPCVFPMIPITVSFFLKQSEKENYRPVVMAIVYCTTIVLVLTFAAVLLLSFFRMLSVSPWMNFGLGALFVFFALSLFGMYEIELPSGLARFTSAREGRGGLLGTIFMALTFTIISFACVAPFLGGFGGTATVANMTWTNRIFGGLAFSVTFASPFFVLALFPSLLKQLPKSGSWLNSVKVVMGFLELAAAFKFFRAGELMWSTQASFLTYDFVMGIWIAICFLCGLYLLGFYRLPHDSPVEHLGVPRMLFAAAFLGLGFYLVPALFQYGEGEKQRPNGVVYAWLDSFLLPDSGDEVWSGDLAHALATARANLSDKDKPQRVFVDFTGVTCTNCKINEQTVFPKPEIRELFRNYELVQLYTDRVPSAAYPPQLRGPFGKDTAFQRDLAAINLEFQRSAFNNEQLPLYVILEPLPDGKIQVLGTYDEGKINNEQAFTQFLREPQAAATPTAQARAR